MFYTVYKTTCLVNGKYYIGVHKTEDLDDEYLGSGKAIIKAIEKYGKEKFRKEILHVFDTKEQMFEKEKELVTEDVVNDRQSYNCKLGGRANWYYINHNRLNHKNNQHLIHSEKLRSDEEYRKIFSEKMSEATRKSYLEGNRKPNPPHSEETRKKLSYKQKKRYEIRGGMSEEHKRKISESLKKRNALLPRKV